MSFWNRVSCVRKLLCYPLVGAPVHGRSHLIPMRGIPKDFLFSHADWFPVAENQKARLLVEIQQLPEHQVLNTSIDDLCDYLVKKYTLDVPVLDEAGIHIDRHDTLINKYIFRDRFIVSGTTIDVIVPFTGEKDAFGIRPTMASLNPPRAVVSDQQLLIKITGAELSPDQVRAQIQSTLEEIKIHLDRLRSSAAGLSNELGPLARTHVEQRRRKFLADHDLVAALGFPLKQRDDAPRTYRAPDVRRRIKVAPPPASTAPFKPEPALSSEDYEHILSVMANMALVMERSPSAFQAMREEDLRQHFLVQLNGQFEGQATGETFNYEGKTDILVRSEGKNIFIAECKYWNGPKKLADTIDKLLGYLSWRDTKAAIVLFNRQKNFSRVIAEIPPTIRAHSNFKRDLGQISETSSRYVFAQRDDPNREMIVTVLAFDVPQPTNSKPNAAPAY
jgi:hypothetical protein